MYTAQDISLHTTMDISLRTAQGISLHTTMDISLHTAQDIGLRTTMDIVYCSGYCVLLTTLFSYKGRSTEV